MPLIFSHVVALLAGTSFSSLPFDDPLPEIDQRTAEVTPAEKLSSGKLSNVTWILRAGLKGNLEFDSQGASVNWMLTFTSSPD